MGPCSKTKKGASVMVEGLIATISVGGKLVSATRTAKRVVDWFRSPGRATEEFLDAGERFDEIREIAVAAYLSRRETDAPDSDAFCAAVAAMVEDRQFAKLHMNLQFEAIREATYERKRMLAHLAAGLTDPGMSINLKARLERISRSLDPEDVLLLRDIALNPSTAATKHLEGSATSFYALASAGCISESQGPWGPNAVVTSLGLSVLSVLESYAPGKGA
jgi:hypothetical protein